jgi:hypothetical protein
MWVNLGGVWSKRRLYIKLAIISGDQLSQDNICGRKPINSGNTADIHHGCGSSCIHLGNALDSNGILSTKCHPPPTKTIKRLNDLALLDIETLKVDILTKTSEITPVKEAQKQNKLAVDLSTSSESRSLQKKY